MNLIERTRAGFVAAFGTEPAGVVFTPGRVNLIGEHVDYNDGLVLPMPIGPGTAVAWGPSDDSQIEAVALDLDFTRDRFTIGGIEPHQPPDWRSYLRGMTACLGERGLPVAGTRLAISGTVPRGSGLSSSASFCVAVGRALADATGKATPPQLLALAAQAAEHRWVGVQCGIMDQMAVSAGEPGHALLLDCRNLAMRLVPMPTAWAVMIVDSGVSRGLVDGHYNARRNACQEAAATLGLASLRDATFEQIEQAGLDPVVRRRARHVVSEIARTTAAVESIERGDLAGLGQILRASHASLRDDFEVSIAPVDALVDCLDAAIVTDGGARMTGGGFGGAVVAVVKRNCLERIEVAVQQGYRTPSGTAPAVIVV